MIANKYSNSRGDGNRDLIIRKTFKRKMNEYVERDRVHRGYKTFAKKLEVKGMQRYRSVDYIKN
jgi:hypothetical protein